MVTSPSINSASSNCVSAAVVPFSALSILIALNAATAHSLRILVQGVFNGSGGLRNYTSNRLFHDRQVDQRRQHAEQHRQPPHRRIGTVLHEHDAAQPGAEKAAN